MQICIDQGNSSCKVALFTGDELKENFVYKEFKEKELNELFENFPIKRSIICSVSQRDEKLINLLKEKSDKFIEFNYKTPIPVQNQYASPQTLGDDRLAAVIGAYSLQKNSNILVIDVGTAITYDFIDKEGRYRGGNISPGVELRLKSLHQHTNRLPLVEINGEEKLLGDDTESAIRAGVINGISFEIDGYIEGIKKKYPETSTFLTGRGAFFFVNKLKNRIFANEFLVLIGLNHILHHNA